MKAHNVETWRALAGQALIVLFALCLIATPLAAASFGGLQAHDFIRLVQLGLLSCAAALSLGTVLTDKAYGEVRTWAWILGALMMVLAVISVARAEVLRGALLELGLLASLGVLVVVTARALDGRDALRLAGWIVLASAALLSFGTLVRYLSGMFEGALYRAWLIPGYSNFRFFNHVQCVTVPLLAAALVWPGMPVRLRRLGWALLALEFCWLLFLGGRATMLALLISVMAVAFLYRARSKAWMRTLISSAALGLLLFGLLFVAAPRIFNVAGDYAALDTVERTAVDTAQARRILWRIALDDIAESPLFGIGPQHYAHRVNHEGAHPHNVYLQVAAEWGLPMLALVLGAAVLGFMCLVRAVRRSEEMQASSWGVGLTAAFVAVAVDGLLSGNFVMPNSQLWIAFALALAVAYVRQVEGGEQAPVSSGWILRGLMAMFIVFSQLALWQGAWPEVLDVSAHVERVRAQVPSAVFNPRFWSHGWF